MIFKGVKVFIRSKGKKKTEISFANKGGGRKLPKPPSHSRSQTSPSNMWGGSVWRYGRNRRANAGEKKRVIK